jgi:Predicted nucleotide-binding protein containing TIR-like domain
VTKPTVFIGSSSEQLPTAYALKGCLEPFAIATVWNEGALELNESIFGALLKATDRFDFAVFIFDADDVAMIRKSKVGVVRDNVLFEFGLFTGRIGTGRAFWVSDRDSTKSHIPADLAGIIHLSYAKPSQLTEKNLRLALVEACKQLEAQFAKLGPRADRTIEELTRVRILCAASTQYSEPRFAEDIAEIQRNFPQGAIESAHGVSARKFFDYFTQGETWDLIHLAMYVDASSGDLIIPTDSATTTPDRIPASGVVKLITMSRAPLLIVVVTCDSLRLAINIAPTTNIIAGYRPIDVPSALNWSSVFYRFLAQGCPLTEAFNRAQAISDPGLLLLAKHDFRLNLRCLSSD